MANWMRKRWLDFRFGHGVYLIFFLSFCNFTLIFYRMLIEQVDGLDSLFGDLWVFLITFVLVYVPAAMIIGAWHRKTQMKVEEDMVFIQSPQIARMFRVLLDQQAGRLSKEEADRVRRFLIDIERKTGETN